MMGGFREWLRQPDVRANPALAVWRRLCWRWHWRNAGAAPLHVEDWWRGVGIDLAHSGSSAVAYYRDFDKDPIVIAMERMIRRGMTVLDVGAHVGAYSLVAAHFAGPQGRVIAIEPQPELAALVRRNAMANGMTVIQVHECAVGAASGEVTFASDRRTLGGWIGPADTADQSFVLPVRTLDDIHADVGRIDFIKLDAAGFEEAVIEGGKRMLAAGDAPDLAVKFYHPSVVAGRHGRLGAGQRAAIEALGYSLFELVDGQWRTFTRDVSEYSLVVVATRRPGVLHGAGSG